MKTLFSILLGSTLLLGFSQCGSSKSMTYKLQENTPFSITNATFTNWVAGVKGGGSGINVMIPISQKDENKIVFDSLYFNQQVVKLEQVKNGYIGRFKTNQNKRKDIILNSDPAKEYGNEAPIMKPKFPFDLKGDEAVISYLENDTKKYYKFKVEKGEQISFP
ncbi:hypothetical protein [Urechidicola croceus]|uniref:Uncharacterized protein n=1 Tax=Urechidicola croceus TaxID=1850246 RepID=A0A1D8P900_9FLAO|nr:hypothetical protein [Urechidicola croceus]AOW21044.1 hypothetical protein LPB138_10285 [Urechidicola croceus]